MPSSSTGISRARACEAAERRERLLLGAQVDRQETGGGAMGHARR